MRRGQLALMTSTHIVDDLYQGAVPALLPFLMIERHYSYAQLSWLALASTGLSSVIQPGFGALADRRACNWLIPAGFLTAAAGISIAGMLNNYLVTWICIAVAGIGVAAYHPAATSQARIVGGNSQQAMSLFSVGGTVGSSLAPAMVTLVVGGLTLSGSYLLALPAVAMAVVWWLRGPSTRYWAGTLGRQPINRAAGWPQVAGTDDWWAFGRIVLVTICWSIPYITVASLTSLHAQRDLHVSQALGAAALTTFTLAGAVGTLSGGWLADRRGRLTAIRAGYFLGVPALAGIVWAPSFWLLIVCTAGFGFAIFLPFSSQVTLAQDYLPNRPGTASGLTLGLAFSAGGLAAPVFGWLSDAHGLRSALTATLGVFVLAVCFALRLRDRVLPGNAGSPGGEDGGDGTAVTDPEIDRHRTGRSADAAAGVE